jgi:hypothetical protein
MGEMGLLVGILNIREGATYSCARDGYRRVSEQRTSDRWIHQTCLSVQIQGYNREYVLMKEVIP